MYRLAWYFKNSPEVKHYGKWNDSRKVVEAWAKEMNKVCPKINHYVDVPK